MNIWTQHRKLKNSWGMFPLTVRCEKESAHQNVIKWEKTNKKTTLWQIRVAASLNELLCCKENDVKSVKKEMLCCSLDFGGKKRQFYLIQLLPFMPLRLTTTHVNQLIKPGGKHLKWLFTIRRKVWFTLKCCKYGYRKECVSVCCNHRQEREREKLLESGR